MRAMSAMLFVAVALVACSKRDPAKTSAPTTGDAAPARGGPDDPLAEKLRHCPTAIDGASIQIDDVAGGIAFQITAADPAATTAIRQRAAHLVELTAGRAARGVHGGGAGGGTMRNCPVVVSNTKVSAEDIAGGSRITIVPTGGYTVDELREETRRRYDALKSP